MPSFFLHTSYRMPSQKQEPLAPTAPDGAPLRVRPGNPPTSLGTALLGERHLPSGRTSRGARSASVLDGPALSPPADVPPERPAG